MTNTADIYRAELIRAAFGDRAHETKVADLHRLNQYAERLAECEQAHEILRHKGYGRAGQSIVDIARSLPDNVRGLLRSLFRRTPASPVDHDPRELHDIWTSR